MALDVLDVTPEQPEVEQAPTQYGAPVKSAAPTKGGISPVGTTLLNPKQTAELLANMERMIAQKTGGMHSFLSGVQDALAYTAPVEGGQQAIALQYRNQQKRQEMEDVFNMRQQMAALQASTQQAQAQREAMNRILGGDGGAPGVTGGQGVQADVFGGAEVPPEIRQAIAMDPVNGPAILQKYLTTAAGERNKAKLNPAWYELTEVVGSDGQIVKVPRLQAVELAMQNPNNPKNRAVIRSSSEIPQTTGAGINQFNVGNVRPAGQSTGFQQPKSYDEGIQIMDKNLQAYGQKGINTLRGVISRWAPPNENDTEALVKAAAQRLGISPDQKIDLSNPVQRQAIGTAIMLQEKGPKQLFAAAPTSTMTDAGGPPRARPGESADSLRQRQELWKKQQETDISTRAQSGTELRKKSGDMIAAIEQNAKNADEVIRTADRVIGHATKYPKEFGYAYQQENPVLAGAANVPGVGPIVEKAVPAMFGAPGESKRRSVTDADARKLGLDFAAQMFSGTGARLGVGLEQMAANAKGVGTELPAETNALNANLVKVAAEKAKEQAAAWRDWRATHGGDNADPYDFMQSPENKRIIEKYDHKLDAFEEQAKKIYPEFFGERKQTTKANRKPLGAILGGQ